MIPYLEQLDQQLFLALNNLGSKNWDWFWLFITSKWSWVPLYVLLTYLLLKKIGARRTLFTLFCIFLLILCSDQGANFLKHSFARLRPCNLDFQARTLAGCGRYGFPSAHAFSSMALAFFVGSILKTKYKYALPILIIWSIVVGYSRTYVGVHYPGDILVGYSLGVILGLTFYKIYGQITKKYFKRTRASIFESTPLLTQEFESHGNCLLCQRNYLPLTLLLSIAFILYLRTEIYPDTFLLEDTPYEIYYEMSGVIISLIGVFIRILTVGYPAENRAYDKENNRVSTTLNTTGIYSLIRHPLYVGNFLLWFGITIWTGNYWFISSFSLVYWIYYEWIVYAKEEGLRKKYPKAYQAWATNVSAFIPRFKNYKKPVLPFHWKKVLRQKKNGLFALFSIFCLFNISGEITDKSPGYNYNFFLIVMTILTGLSYIVLRYLHTRTALLNDDFQAVEAEKQKGF